MNLKIQRARVTLGLLVCSLAFIPVQAQTPHKTPAKSTRQKKQQAF